MIKGNKGEWSEFYAFLKILVDKKLFGADENLNAIENKFLLVLQIIREEAKMGKRIYDISGDNGDIRILNSDNVQIAVIDENRIKPSVAKIFQKMKEAPDTTFEIEIAQEMMDELECTQIKAICSKKSDIETVIKDNTSPGVHNLGFSIKSMLGSPATLLNASGATNFIFRVEGFNGDIAEVNEIDSRSKVRDRINKIREMGGSLIFDGLQSDVFEKNLIKIETVLPEILAETVKSFFEGKGNNVIDLMGAISTNKELSEKTKLESREDYEFKIKRFLADVALGMMPKKKWDGLTQAHGGYIVVKEDGDIVCYHLYNRDDFQDYLLKNTRLETPGTTKHKYAELYREDGNLYLKLNLQIRFLK